jgi:hypothetical protein
MKKIFKQLLFPHGVILLVFAVITYLFLNPVFSGKTLEQNDVRQWKGMNAEIEKYRDEGEEHINWTNSMFGGMPTYQISPFTKYGLIGLTYIYSAIIHSFPMPANALFAYMVGFYLLMLALRINPWLGMGGAIVYAFSSYNIIIIEAGHMAKCYALAIAPMVLGAIMFTYQSKKYLLGAGLIATAFAFQIRTNHPQITYYLGLVVGIYLLFEAFNFFKERKIKQFVITSLIVGGAAIVGVSTGFTYLYMTYEYGKDTIRGKSDLSQQDDVQSDGLDRDYAFGWSYGVGESFSLLIPNVRGGGSEAVGKNNKSALKKIDPQAAQVVAQMDQYWGSQPFTSGPVYIGAGILFLFVFAMVKMKTRHKWWILTVSVLSIVLAWGNNFGTFNNLMFDYFPLYNKFRSVNMTLVMVCLVAPMLGIMFLNDLIQNKQDYQWKQIQKSFLISFAATGGICLLVFLSPSIIGNHEKPEGADRNSLIQANFPENQADFVVENLVEVRKSITKSDGLRSFVFILLIGGVLFAYFTNKVDEKILIGGAILILCVDLVSLDTRFIEKSKFKVKKKEKKEVPNIADTEILKDPSLHYRVLSLNNPFNDASVSNFHKSIGGYHGAKIRRFQEFREWYYDTLVSRLSANIQKFPAESIIDAFNQNGDMKAVNMLNGKYLLFNPLSAQGYVENKGAYGNAWFVNTINWVETADEEISSIRKINPLETVTINTKYKSYLENSDKISKNNNKIKLLSYHPEKLVYEYEASSEGFVVFSEIYYNSGKGWQAYIDNEPVEHIQVNFLLRGMKVPKGKHIIEYRFEPSSFKMSENISLASSVFLVVLLGLGLFFETKNNLAKN